jgi:hypothetical protein
MYCINGNSSWYSDCGPLFGGCPLLGVSVIGGSTVVQMPGKATEVYTREWHTPDYEARTRFIVRVLRC